MAASQIVTFLTLEEQVVENIEVTAKIAAKDNSFFSSAGWIPSADYVPTETGWYKPAVEGRDVYVSTPYIDAYTNKEARSEMNEILEKIIADVNI